MCKINGVKNDNEIMCEICLLLWLLLQLSLSLSHTKTQTHTKADTHTLTHTHTHKHKHAHTLLQGSKHCLLQLPSPSDQGSHV